LTDGGETIDYEEFSETKLIWWFPLLALAPLVIHAVAVYLNLKRVLWQPPYVKQPQPLPAPARAPMKGQSVRKAAATGSASPQKQRGRAFGADITHRVNNVPFSASPMVNKFFG
jgi:hypothetical protein